MRRNAKTETACLFLLVASQLALLQAAAVQRTTTQTFDTVRGETLIVQNDYGRVRLEAWQNPYVEIRMRVIAQNERQLNEVSLLAHKNGDKIFVEADFHQYVSESVYVDIQAPSYLNLVVWGANPAVEVFGLEGYARINTLSGLITAEDLMGTTSLVSESGDILYRFSRQPFADIRLESVHGDIQVRAHDDIEFRSWVKAGGALVWGDELQLARGSLEKQVGDAGPLVYASSQEGAVRFRFESHIQSQLSMTRTDSDSRIPEATTVRVSRQGEENLGGRAEPGSVEPKTDQEIGDSDSSASQSSTGGAPAYSTRVSQTPPPAPGDSAQPPGGYSFKVHVNWVYLNASVRNASSNRAVGNLGRNDFLVFEDGVQQNVEEFKSTEAPFHLLLLLDVSGSTKSFINLIREASIEFTRQIKANDRIALAVFNSRSRLIQEFTNDRQEMARAINRIRSGGGTAFYDALHDSITDYMRGIEGRKAIVVFSDGVDNQLSGDYSNGSQIAFRDVFREIQELDTLIYTIFLDTAAEYGGTRSGSSGGGLGGILADILRGQTRPVYTGGRGISRIYEEAREQMVSIAEQTGGRFYSPRGINDLTRVYNEIADDLRLQYTLGYKSTNPSQDGNWRNIEVSVRDRRDLIVRSRKGYYAGS